MQPQPSLPGDRQGADGALQVVEAVVFVGAAQPCIQIDRAERSAGPIAGLEQIEQRDGVGMAESSDEVVGRRVGKAQQPAGEGDVAAGRCAGQLDREILQATEEAAVHRGGAERLRTDRDGEVEAAKHRRQRRRRDGRRDVEVRLGVQAAERADQPQRGAVERRQTGVAQRDRAVVDRGVQIDALGRHVRRGHRADPRFDVRVESLGDVGQGGEQGGLAGVCETDNRQIVVEVYAVDIEAQPDARPAPVEVGEAAAQSGLVQGDVDAGQLEVVGRADQARGADEAPEPVAGHVGNVGPEPLQQGAQIARRKLAAHVDGRQRIVAHVDVARQR